MGLPLRDNLRHVYGEYLTWPEDVRYELIDGEAYQMAPAGVKECWFVHPTDRTVSAYVLAGLVYGRAVITELTGFLAEYTLPSVTIDWSRALGEHGAHEFGG